MKIEMPSKSDLCSFSTYISNKIPEQLFCPRCKANSDDGCWFYIKIMQINVLLSMHRLKGKTEDIWAIDKQHVENGEIFGVRCGRCHYSSTIDDFKFFEKINIEVNKMKVKVLKLDSEWAILSSGNKIIYLHINNVARGIQEKEEGILTGISYNEVSHNEKITSSDVFLRKI